MATVPQRLRSSIDVLRVQAKVLYDRAQDEEIKEHVRTAQRDLGDALSILDQGDASETSGTPPALLMSVVYVAVKSATLRLQMVAFALHRIDEPGVTRHNG